MQFFKRKNKEVNLDLPPPPPGPDNLDDAPISEDSLANMGKDPGIQIGDNLNDSELSPQIDDALPPPAQKDDSNSPSFDDLEKDLPPVPDLDQLEDQMPDLHPSNDDDIPEMQMPDINTEPEEVQIAAGPVEDKENIIEAHDEESSENEEISNKPVFVSVNSYKEITDEISLIRGKLRETDKMVDKLTQIKKSKDLCYDQFRSKLENIQKKSLWIEKNVLKGGVKIE